MSASPPRPAPLTFSRTAYRQACRTRLARLYATTAGHRSVWPSVGFVASGAGKLLLGEGLGLWVGAAYRRESGAGVAAGAALTSVGLALCVTVALAFGNEVRQVDPWLGLGTTAASLSATLLIACGNVVRTLGELDLIAHGDVCLLPLLLGMGVLSFTLPTFTSYAKITRGRLPALDGRGAEWAVWAVGIGLTWGRATSNVALPGGSRDAFLVVTLLLVLYSRALVLTERLAADALLEQFRADAAAP